MTKFDASNWWKWGRCHHVSDAPRLYVNQKTRNPRPFFLNGCRNYNGAVLALFPHCLDANLECLCDMLNNIDWDELGFVCDGRFLFAQSSLAQTLLPEDFAPFASRPLL